MRVNKYTVMYENPGCNLALVRESARNYDVQFRCPRDVYDAMNLIFNSDNLPEEHVWLIAVDTRRRCRGIMEISKGSGKASMCPVREILRDVLMMDGTAFSIVHNYPSGDSSPSREDKAVTEKLRNAAKLMELCLDDHIIIGAEGNYYSFHEHEWR